MKIIVEIGTAEQKELIEKELVIIKEISKPFNPPLPILSLIVPKNFDDKINELEGTKNYVSMREHHHAQAKTVKTPTGIHLVFSSSLFIDKHDHCTRMLFYIHEFLHVVNSVRFPEIKKEITCKYQSLQNLYTLFDEYDVNRKSLAIVDKFFPIPSEGYRRMVRIDTKFMIKPLINDQIHYDIIQSEINNFRIHGDVRKFLNKAIPHFDAVSKAIVYSYAFIDHFPRFKKFLPLLSKSKFMNNKTIKLMEFFRKKFNEENVNLYEGIGIMDDFIRNFGMKFEDTSQGIYCHVVDVN